MANGGSPHTESEAKPQQANQGEKPAAKQEKSTK